MSAPNSFLLNDSILLSNNFGVEIFQEELFMTTETQSALNGKMLQKEKIL